jgi:hypothetical protein
MANDTSDHWSKNFTLGMQLSTLTPGQSSLTYNFPLNLILNFYINKNFELNQPSSSSDDKNTSDHRISIVLVIS